jgi:hypothetical protein
MSLYLAAWPNLTFSIVHADGEDEAMRKLGRLESPDVAKVTKYEGPLFLDFEWHLKNPTDAQAPVASVRLSGDDQALYDRVLEFAFPHFYAYYQAVQDRRKDPSLEEAKAALSLDKDTFPERAKTTSGLSDLDDKLEDLFDRHN